MDVSDALDAYLVKQIIAWGSDSEKEMKPISVDRIRDLTNKDESLTMVKKRILLQDWGKYEKNPLISPYYGEREN